MCLDSTNKLLPVILIVDGDLESRRRTARVLSPHAITRPAPTVAAAREALAFLPVAGVVLDPNAADGDGLVFLEELRGRHGMLPVLVLSGTQDVTEASRVSALKAEFVSKFEAVSAVEARLGELAAAALGYRESRDALVLGLANRFRLTGAERETLVHYVRRGERAGLAEHLRIAETSLRSRVRGLCRKLDIPRLEAVYRLLFEEAVTVRS